jgi:hypothetical protein
VILQSIALTLLMGPLLFDCFEKRGTLRGTMDVRQKNNKKKEKKRKTHLSGSKYFMPLWGR